jgi:hypothetical protein
MKKNKTTQPFATLGKRMVVAVILALATGGSFWAQAAFVEPATSPINSVQDFAQNILGANNADNNFGSSLVVANATGSIIERLQYIQANLPWDISGSNINYASGNVGIGVPSPSRKLEVNGSVEATDFYGDGSHLTGITSFSTSTTRAVFSATSPIAYNSGTGAFSVASGYTIPVTASTTNWNTAYNSIGTLTNNKWCSSDGSQINCTNNAPAVTESDPIWVASSSNYYTKTQADNNYLGKTATSSDSNLLQGHNAAYFQIAGSYQPAGSYLTSVTGTNLDNVFSSNGLLKRTGSGTYTVDTNTYLTTETAFNASAAASITTASTTAWNNLSNSLTISNGNLGIGSSTPSAKLSVQSTTGPQISVAYDNSNAGTLNVDSSGNLTVASKANSTTIIGSGTTALAIATNGYVGIGTTSPSYTMDVVGDVRVSGTMYYGSTSTPYSKPDFVFQDGYKVMGTDEVEKYLLENNHLPWMTSAKDEKAGVIDMTRMGFQTVETAENLQMQIIELNKKVKALEDKLQ